MCQEQERAAATTTTTTTTTDGRKLNHRKRPCPNGKEEKKKKRRESAGGAFIGTHAQNTLRAHATCFANLTMVPCPPHIVLCYLGHPTEKHTAAPSTHLFYSNSRFGKALPVSVALQPTPCCRRRQTKKLDASLPRPSPCISWQQRGNKKGVGDAGKRAVVYSSMTLQTVRRHAPDGPKATPTARCFA